MLHRRTGGRHDIKFARPSHIIRPGRSKAFDSNRTEFTRNLSQTSAQFMHSSLSLNQFQRSHLWSMRDITCSQPHSTIWNLMKTWIPLWKLQIPSCHLVSYDSERFLWRCCCNARVMIRCTFVLLEVSYHHLDLGENSAWPPRSQCCSRSCLGVFCMSDARALEMNEMN